MRKKRGTRGGEGFCRCQEQACVFHTLTTPQSASNPSALALLHQPDFWLTNPSVLIPSAPHGADGESMPQRQLTSAIASAHTAASWITVVSSLLFTIMGVDRNIDDRKRYSAAPVRGAIAGIVVGTILGVAMLGLAIWIIAKRQRRHATNGVQRNLDKIEIPVNGHRSTMQKLVTMQRSYVIPVLGSRSCMQARFGSLMAVPCAREKNVGNL